MPNIKSAAKAMRSSARKKTQNLRIKSRMRDEVKALRKLISSAKTQEATSKFADVMRALDKAVKKHVVKKNTASRIKSRLAKAIAKLSK